MKEKDVIAKATSSALPDKEEVRRKCINSAPAKRGFTGFKPVRVAAFLTVLILAVAAYPYMKNLLGGGAALQPQDNEMRGLPVENFTLSDVQDSSLISDRLGCYDFASLFRLGFDNFAVVKVGSVQTVADGENPDLVTYERQISKISILYHIYGETKSKNLQISQSVIKDHFCLGTTNLLREGAVYLLPLVQYDDGWYVSGDMDVLFEVDDKGIVWSHSDHPAFKQYDGKAVDELISELQGLFTNEDFLLANSRFSTALQGFTLADITVTGKSELLNDDYGQYYNYSFTLNEILSEPEYSEYEPLGGSGVIMVYADEDPSVKLADENRYLLCLDRFNGKISTRFQMIAQIKDTGAIEVTAEKDSDTYFEESIFASYDGATVTEIKNMIARINAWKDLHQQ